MKLTGSVGRKGRNDKGAVALVQQALATISRQTDVPRAAKKTADRIKAAAPFPVKERNALADAVQAVAKELGIALALDETWITRAGNFAATFDIDGDLAATPSEKGEVMRKIAQVVLRKGVWLRRMPNSLDFESRRQLRSLKAAAKILPVEDKELLELTSEPKDPVLAALAQGSAELIRSGAIAIPRGKEEYNLILEAAANADPALAKELTAAADGESRLRKELVALEGAAAAMARTLDLDSRTRDWYKRQIKKMSDDLLAQARSGRIPWPDAWDQAYNARGKSMSHARSGGSALGLEWAKLLKEKNPPKAVIENKILRDKFGGRSLKSLIETERQRLYQLAIESSGRSGARGDRPAKAFGYIGRGVAILTFATAAYSVYMADDRVQELARQSAILGGGVLGGMAGGAAAGAAAGATVGAATGLGVVIFVAGGILVGGVLGSLGAEFAFEELID